jgi:hypothetical protein
MSNNKLAWSISRLHLYEMCPLRFKLKNIDKLPDPPNPAMQRGLDVHKKAENFVKGTLTYIPRELYSFDAQFRELQVLKDDPEATVLLEEKWCFTDDWKETSWFGKDAACRVVTDASVVYTDGTADVVDYKTGKPYGANQDQMKLFSLAAFIKFEDLKTVTTRLWYVDTGDEICETFYEKDIDPILDEFEPRVEKMRADRTYAPRPGPYCKNCPYSKSAGGPCKYG